MDDAVLALRTSVALSVLDHVSLIRITGDDAFDAADRVYTRELYLRDGQLGHGLLLNGDATVFADVYLGSDDEDFFFLSEGPASKDLLGYLRRHTSELTELEFTEESASHAIVAMDGPYAWELLAALAGSEVIGLPYLTFFRLDGRLCYRAGKTGEYGYRLVVPRDELSGTLDELRRLGAPLDLTDAGLETLDQCALENWFFNIRREGRVPVSPLELQLQWRVSSRKSYPGAQTLAQRRDAGIARRITAVASKAPLAVGDRVRMGDDEIGEVVNAGFSPIRQEWVGQALLDLAWAHPHLGELRAGTADAPARTVRPPVVNNRSLYVNPQLQSYATRLEDDFPPL